MDFAGLFVGIVILAAVMITILAWSAALSRPCPHCEGRGHYPVSGRITIPCFDCRGKGRK